ncbi:MAG: helix-turn-helix transcriptional regulator [Bacteroidota bacterium]
MSLVEDYRKSKRVYMDQIIQQTEVDSNGVFYFEGSFLSEENRIYRIHMDNCSSSEKKSHFLRACEDTQSLLFIGNNRDTIAMPLGYQEQAFCQIISTNTASGKILEAELLKESMIFDIESSDGETARHLKYQKWLEKFQDFGIKSQEPLVELYNFNFLSERSSETYAAFVKDRESSGYYSELLMRLVETYPKAVFTKQYLDEEFLESPLAEKPHKKAGKFSWRLAIRLISLVVLIGMIVFFFKMRKKRISFLDQFENLSPREKSILNSILNKKTNKEIASELFISVSTVKTHINNIYKKLGVRSREEIQMRYKG